MRLRQYYDVGYTEATYYVDKQVFYFNFKEDNSAIVRVFPLKDYFKLDPENKMKTLPVFRGREKSGGVLDKRKANPL